MAEPDPIRQLQHLLDDPGKVLERISRIQSAIGSIRSASASEPEAAAPTSPVAEAIPTLKSEERPYEDSLRVLRDMQTQIERRIRPLALAFVQSEVERLRALARREQAALDACVAQLDQNLLACVDRIDESRKLHAELRALSRRLTELGAAAEPVPEFPTSPDPQEVLKSRVEHLRRRGQI